MRAEEWIDERRRAANNATAGEWKLELPDPDDDQSGQYIIDSEVCGDIWIVNFDNPDNQNDPTAVVDAHNHLPKAIDALEAVLRLHKPHKVRVNGQVELFCLHCEDVGDWNEARSVEYPCPTVQAINEALGVDGE